MELSTNDCDGTNPATAFSFVLSDSLGTEILDAESAGSIIFPTDFDINKLLKTGNGVQVLFIDSSQVGIVSENGAAIITSSPLQDEIEGGEQPNLTEIQVGRNHPDSFHVETSMINDVLSCSECGATFKKNADYKRHQLQHLDKKPHQCPNCNLSFNVEKNLKLHMALHNTSSQCPECGKKFSRLASLKAHISLHIEEDTLTCQQCDNEFETMRALRRHIEEEHQLNKTAPLTLAELNHSFNGSANRETDPVIKIFPCKQCHDNFNTMRALKEHSRYHQKVNSILSCKKKSKNNKVVGKPRFRCSHCSMEFDKPSLRARHERVHTGERPYKCDQCNRGFSQKNSLVSHQKAIHGREKPYQCTLCPYASSQKGNLRAHVRRLHLLASSEQQGDVHRCDDCSAVFRNVSSLTSHMSKFHCDGIQTHLTMPQLQNSDSMAALNINDNDSAPRDDLSHKNDILQKALERIGLPLSDGGTENSDQRNGEQNKTKERSACTTTLVDRANPAKLVQYVVEYRMENSVRFLLCGNCPKRFKKPLDLVRHLRIHNSIMPYKCPVCHKTFRLKSTLMSHLNSHNGTKAFECPVCCKKLASQASLVLHQRLHTGQRPYCCQFCGKQFRHRSYFKVHLQAHQRSAKSKTKTALTSEEPRIASDSLKTGANMSVTLAEPLELTESGILPRQPVNAQLFSRSEEKNGTRQIRPFKCLQCGAAFKKSAHLNQHIQTHSGLKPFTCNICLRNFVSKWVLKAHHLTHERTSAPNFQCSECNRSFTTRGTLNRHKASHSDSRPFICPYCQKSFKTYSVCKKHVGTHTNEVIHMQQAQSSSELPEVSIDAEALENSTTLPPMSETQTESHWDLLNYEPSNMPADSSTTQPSDESTLNGTREVTDVHSLPCTTSTLSDASSFGPMQLGMEFDGEEASDVTDAPAHSDLPTLYDNQVLSQSFTFQESELLTAPTEDSKREETKCLSCGREFKRASHLKTHMRSNCGANKSHVCPICTKSFATAQALTAHEKSHTDPDPEPMHCVCDSCGLKFLSFQLYLRHTEEGCTQTNALETSFKDQDSAIFTDTSSTQGGVANVIDKISKSLKECTQCNKSFKKQSDLVRHMRTHTGERPFACEICDKSFTLKSTLTAHSRTHSANGNKTVSCELCNGLYSCRNTLRIHMRIHTGDKPFKCPECNLFFRTTGHRQSHLKSHRKAAQAVGKPGAIRTVSSAANKRKLKAKSNKQRVLNGDMDSEAHLAKVIAISGDLSNQHNSLGDQSGSLGNLTVKFHLDEAGNVQLPTLDSTTLLDLRDLSDLFLTQSDGQVQGIALTQEMNLSHLLTVSESNRDELSRNLMNSESGLRLLTGNHGGTMLVSSSHADQHHSEVEEGADHTIMLEAVDPVVILGASSETSPERVSVITARNRNFQK
ncbi:zinc finger protein 236-like isoform X2 [Daphnia pulex]|uniref:zinc finger protein 236-like isoform X2 n=1 Tax=Daphnia pulex TaxID=6669 RepID=UPI001EE08826|nr:zinc finger protein 236-like isoform X2 [Daphnia pulex]